MTRIEREQHRREVVRTFRESGLTQKALCEQRGLALSTLRYWFSRERPRKAQPQPATLVSVGTVDAVKTDSCGYA